MPRHLDDRVANAEPDSDLRDLHADSNGVAGCSDADAVTDADVISTAGE